VAEATPDFPSDPHISPTMSRWTAKIPAGVLVDMQI
jgi:hypothetical protein